VFLYKIHIGHNFNGPQVAKFLVVSNDLHEELNDWMAFWIP